jgi:predicted transcriptional regulator
MRRRKAERFTTDAETRGSGIVQGIKRGLADLKAGRLVPHEQAMAELDAMIAKAARRRK